MKGVLDLTKTIDKLHDKKSIILSLKAVTLCLESDISTSATENNILNHFSFKPAQEHFSINTYPPNIIQTKKSF